MTADDLEAYLHAHIPLTAAMCVRVVEAAESVVLSAPLDANVNHLGTAFGGSIATLAITAGWCWLKLQLSPETQLVIKGCEMEYVSPIQGEFLAVCSGSREEGTDLAKRLARKGKVKIKVHVDVMACGEVACRMRGSYVAIA